jgi:lantibiotic modifying enzyme
MQWCHGPPGIGLFYAELHRLTGSAAHLDTAVRCAAAMDAEREHASACQCHGLAGNAQLYLALHRRTGDAAWLDAARRYGELLWERRLRGTEFPEWTSGDSSRTHTPSLMTGTTGVGWLYLQLARAGALGAPGLDWGGGGGA